MKEYDLLKYWQNRLNLNDWNIKLLINMDICEMSGTFGYVEFTETTKYAVIRIVDKNKLDNERKEIFNFEKTLVHELLHLKFSLFDNSGNDFQDRYLHQYIEEFSLILTKKDK